MENKIEGIHHITAIAGDAKRNYDFYTKVLGQRFIKKTVNFDDPQTYHFYYGNEAGEPGTILTFFPWGAAVRQGRRGAGMATEFAYAVPKGSLDFWIRRFDQFNVLYNKPAEKFGTRYLSFNDSDALKIELVETTEADGRIPYLTAGIGAEVAIKGFYNITLTLNHLEDTAAILTDVFDYQLITSQANRYRYATHAADTANIIDLVQIPSEPKGLGANGTIHHVAFRVKDDATQLAFHDLLQARGMHITPQIDRNYFHSVYFREPGGVLFEIATDNPGFTVDEPLNELGSHLKLPVQFEPQRQKIEAHLAPLDPIFLETKKI